VLAHTDADAVLQEPKDRGGSRDHVVASKLASRDVSEPMSLTTSYPWGAGTHTLSFVRRSTRLVERAAPSVARRPRGHRPDPTRAAHTSWCVVR